MPSKGKKVASRQNSLKKKKRAAKPTIQQFIQSSATSNDTDENQIDVTDTTYITETPVTQPEKVVQKKNVLLRL